VRDAGPYLERARPATLGHQARLTGVAGAARLLASLAEVVEEEAPPAVLELRVGADHVDARALVRAAPLLRLRGLGCGVARVVQLVGRDDLAARQDLYRARVLEPPERSALLARSLLRFSPLALASVVALVATGATQSLLHIDRFGALVDTGFGRAILVKVALLLVLIGLGAVQRRRVVPALRRIADAGEAPGGAGRLLRNVLRAEVVLVVGVLAATSALVASAPPDSVADGPWSKTTRIGDQTLEATVDPARVGLNELHVYLLDARTGAPFAGTKELTVEARLPAKRIGPLDVRARRAGPGHYVVPGLELVPGGTWRIDVASRTSEFDEDRATLEVPVR